jgi:mitochondrial fission protein ELM1
MDPSTPYGFMSTPLQITVLTDGKPGHVNQSLGLAEAIGRMVSIKVEILPTKKRSFSVPRLQSRPDLIIGAGHATHLPMIILAKRHRAPSVVLMKPSLPLFLFDACVLPEHDLGKKNWPAHVIPTEGALNRVPPPSDAPRNGGLILVGGPSTHHDWDPVQVSDCIRTIVQSGGNRPWRITDSRRSPSDTLEFLKKECPALVTYPHSTTGPEWLPQRLAEAFETWVSEDSISMIYEALSSGSRVGLIPVPRSGTDARVTRGVDRLIKDGWVTPFGSWEPGTPIPPPPRILREAERVAGIILDRLSIRDPETP